MITASSRPMPRVLDEDVFVVADAVLDGVNQAAGHRPAGRLVERDRTGGVDSRVQLELRHGDVADRNALGNCDARVEPGLALEPSVQLQPGAFPLWCPEFACGELRRAAMSWRQRVLRCGSTVAP